MPTTSIRNPEDAVNASLIQIGLKLQVGSLYDGSDAANKALAIYGQTRDDLMRDGNWRFAARSGALTLWKAAPAGGYVPGFTTWTPQLYPQQPWKFSYLYPDDCLKMQIVKPSQIFPGPNFDPTPYPFTLANDSGSVPPRKVILTNLVDPIGAYIGRVTDPQFWDASFTETFIDELGKRLAPALADLGAAQLNAALGADDKNTAKMEQN